MDGPLSIPLLARLERLRVATRHRHVGRFSARRRSSRLGRGLEFAGHRPYTPGDDFKDVDWTLYGRLDRFYVRQAHEETELDVTLVVDVSRSMWVDGGIKGQLAAEVSAALGWMTLARLDQLRVAPFAGQLLPPWTPPRSRVQALFVHQRLLGFGEGGGAQKQLGASNLERAAQQLASSTMARGLAVVISDFCLPWQRGIDVLRSAGFEPSLIRITSPNESRPQPLGSEVMLEDAETGERLRVEHDLPITKRYRHHFGQFAETVHRYARSRGIAHAALEAGGPIDEQMIDTLRVGGIVL